MAGTPTQLPKRFVCVRCYGVSVGVPQYASPAPDEYETPATCGACGQDEFVAIDQFHQIHDEPS